MALPELLESMAEPEPEPARRNRPARPPRYARPAEPAKPPVRRPVVIATGVALCAIALLVLGFFAYLYGLSGLSEQRAQSVLYKTFAGELGQATAPVAATTDGAPVAILAIPRLGVSDLVVVEGTSPRDLTHGPGHLPSTVLPGQAGVSVLYGRVATYGAPFAHLMRLQRGDRITVITGQGVSTYVVESFGTDSTPPPDQTADRLLLEAGGSSAFPDSAVEVSADLTSNPQPTPPATGTAAGTAAGDENALAGDPGAIVPLVFWAQGLVLVLVAGGFAARRWSRGSALLCAAPVAFALVWAVYENLSLLLPNLY